MKTLEQYLEDYKEAAAAIASAEKRLRKIKKDVAAHAPFKIGEKIDVPEEAYCYRGKRCLIDFINIQLYYGELNWRFSARVLRKNAGTPTSLSFEFYLPLEL